MTATFARKAAAEALRSVLGPNASFVLCDRTAETPMGFTLDVALRHLSGVEPDVYWVESGPPVLFCLPGITPAPIAFSRRFLSISAFVRRLFSEQAIDDVVEDMARRSALKLMAEFALRAGAGDLAAELFIESIVGKDIWLDDSDEQARALELEPKNESYMAVWFYGLMHELGHLSSACMEARTSLFPDPVTLQYIEVVLNRLEHYPEEIKADIRTRALRMRSTSSVGIDTLRTEAMADLFAVSGLLEAGAKMAAIEGRSFDVWVLIKELLYQEGTLSLIDRCSSTVKVALLGRSDQTELVELLICPSVALSARSFMLRPRLELIVARYLYGAWPTDSQLEPVSQLMNQINDEHLARIGRIEAGLSRAMEFALYPARRAALLERLEGFRIQLMKPNVFFQAELTRFTTLADELGCGTDHLFSRIRIVALDPQNMRFQAPNSS